MIETEEEEEEEKEDAKNIKISVCESPKAVTTEGTTNCYTKADARGHFRFRFPFIHHLDHDRSRGITRSKLISDETKRFDLKAASCICGNETTSAIAQIIRSHFLPFRRSRDQIDQTRLSVFYYRRFSQFDSCFSSASLFVYHRGTCVCVCVHRKRLLRLGA